MAVAWEAKRRGRKSRAAVTDRWEVSFLRKAGVSRKGPDHLWAWRSACLHKIPFCIREIKRSCTREKVLNIEQLPVSLTRNEQLYPWIAVPEYKPESWKVRDCVNPEFEGSSVWCDGVVMVQHIHWCPYSLHFGEWTINQLLASHRHKIPSILARCFDRVAEVSIDIPDHSLVSMAGKCKRLAATIRTV